MLPIEVSAIAGPFRIGQVHTTSGYGPVAVWIVFCVPSGFITGLHVLAAHNANSPVQIVKPGGGVGVCANVVLDNNNAVKNVIKCFMIFP
jgi:hypothetical protein